MCSKGGSGILSLSLQQGWERDSLCECISRVGEGFSLRGILWERDSPHKCTARTGNGFSLEVYTTRVGEGFSLSVYNKGRRGILSSVQQGWERDSL